MERPMLPSSDLPLGNSAEMWVPSEGGSAIFRTPSLYGTLPVKSWKSLRDARIVKQDKDFSCGSASLATLLNEFYGQSVTEEQLLKAMDKGDLRASFDDMQRALPQFGFRAQVIVSKSIMPLASGN